MKKRLLLIYFIIFYCHAIFAQLHIAKDNINCLYGLKNENNKWVLKPTYTYIEEAYHNSSVFQVFDGQYRGIISAEDGKVIIPCCQDRFDINSHYFLGYKNEKIMVYNRNGKPLSEQIYDDIKPYEFSHDYLWCYKNYPDSVLTSLMQVDLGFLFHDVNGYVHEWMDSTYTIVQKYKGLSSQYMGVIDSLGKTIIPQNYNSIEIKKGYFIATNDTATFFLNDKNILIYPPFLSIEKANKNKSYLYLLSNKDASCAVIDDKLNIIIPFNKYDKIKYLRNGKYWYQNGNSEIKNLASLFCVTKNNKMGVVDSAGNEIIPLKYDDLKPIITNDTCVKFAFKENNKHGIINEKGEIILNANYNLPIIDSRYKDDIEQVKYLVNDKEVYFMDYYSCNLSKLDYLFENNFGSVFYGHNRVVLIKNSPLINKPILFYNSDSISVDLDDYSVKNRYIKIHHKTKSGQFALHVYDLKGEEIYPSKLKTFYRSGFYLPNTKINEFGPTKFYSAIFAVTKYNRLGLFSYYSGKLLIDTLYSSIISSSHVFYNSNKMNLICKHYLSNKYDIYDTLGTIIKTINCDTIYQDQNFNYKKATINGKMGIVNNNYDWLIKPQYKYIESLTENIFLIVNQNKKIGIIDVNNKLIVDTTYTDFLPVFNNYHPDFFAANDTINGFTINKKERWWLLKNSNLQILVNDKGNSIKSSSSTDSSYVIIQNMLLNFAFNGAYMHCGDGFCDYSFIKSDGSHNIADGALKITMIKEDKEFLLKQPYINQLFDILERAYLNEIKILKNYNNSAFGFTTDNRKILKNVLHKEIYSFGKSYVSLYFNYFFLSPDSSAYSNDYYSNYSYENYIAINSKLNLVTLDSILKNDGFFQAEIEEAIKKEEDLKLDCTNINNLYQAISGRFSLSKDGIYLMIEDENYNRRELLIPK